MVKLIQFSMCSVSGKKCNPYALTASIEIQRLLLLINSKPLSANKIAKELGMPMSEVTKYLNKLVKCGLIKVIDGLYRPAFAILTLEDQKVLSPLIESLSDDIVKVFEEGRDKLEETINSLTITNRGLKFNDLEYIIVGAITLDYEGLEVLSKEGMLIKAKRMPFGGEYVFAGFETGLINLKESWMWGHSEFFGRYWFNSHGKLPLRGIRKALPDLIWLWDKSEIKSKVIEIGKILETLLYKDLSFEDLHKVLNIDKMSLAIDLTVLLALDYLRLNEGVWVLNIPAFTLDDYKLIKSFSESMLKMIARGFKDKIDEMMRYYSRTLPAINGIPFKESFNQLYHIIFERALNKLIDKNIIRAPSMRCDGGRYSTFMIIID